MSEGKGEFGRVVAGVMWRMAPRFMERREAQIDRDYREAVRRFSRIMGIYATMIRRPPIAS